MKDHSTPQDAAHHEPAASDEITDELARAIHELDRVTGLELSFEVGQLILDHFYEGDIQRLRARGPDDSRLAALSTHPELGLGRRGLERVVGVYEILADLGGPSACQHIGADHLRAVLSLGSPVRKELLGLAESHRWSVVELEHAVRVMGSLRPPARADAACARAASSCQPTSAARASQAGLADAA